MNTIATQFGEVTLLAPPPGLVQAIRDFLPFGLIHNVPPEQGAIYGLVMQCGKLELLGVRQQPEDASYEQCLRAQEDNNILIAHSLAGYLKAGFTGLFLPCTYLVAKKPPLFQSSIAYFGYPSPHAPSDPFACVLLFAAALFSKVRHEKPGIYPMV